MWTSGELEQSERRELKTTRQKMKSEFLNNGLSDIRIKKLWILATSSRVKQFELEGKTKNAVKKS